MLQYIAPKHSAANALILITLYQTSTLLSEHPFCTLIQLLFQPMKVSNDFNNLCFGFFVQQNFVCSPLLQPATFIYARAMYYGISHERFIQQIIIVMKLENQKRTCVLYFRGCLVTRLDMLFRIVSWAKTNKINKKYLNKGQVRIFSSVRLYRCFTIKIHSSKFIFTTEIK